MLLLSERSELSWESFEELELPEFEEELLEELEPEPVGQIGALVERKYLRALDDERGRRRTVAALQRLGYRWEDIRRALKEYEIPEG